MLIRRSNRIQTKNSQVQSENPKKEPLVNSPAVKVEIESESDQEETQKCFGCKQKHPPIRRYPQTYWIECDNCDQWWHIECACITKEDNDKLTRCKISYSCALCVLKGSPWIVSNHDLSLIAQSNNENAEACKQESRVKVAEKPCLLAKEKEIESKNIIVVDNIKDSQDWKSSTVIREKLNEFEELKDIDFAYSLPHGGIAKMHCNTEKEAETILNSWPEKVFAEQEKPHRPKEAVPCKVGYL